jgi:hypothetical protein
MHSFIYREFMLAWETGQRCQAERDRRVNVAIGRRPRRFSRIRRRTCRP